MYYLGLFVVNSVGTVRNIIKDDLQTMAHDMILHNLVNILIIISVALLNIELSVLRLGLVLGLGFCYDKCNNNTTNCIITI